MKYTRIIPIEEDISESMYMGPPKQMVTEIFIGTPVEILELMLAIEKMKNIRIDIGNEEGQDE